MKTTAPSYYKEFKCKAGDCNHSCCVGWEIYIDDEALKLYKSSQTSLSEKICKNIKCSPDGAQFAIDENKKCPFLLEDGLCEIIKEAGEGWLCQICRDHPRFRNYFSDRVEIGLGMCCEEAARLILSAGDFSMIVLEEDTEVCPDSDDEEFFRQRQWLFEHIYNNDKSFSEAIECIKSKYPSVSLVGSPNYWFAFLGELERMDGKWNEYLEYLKAKETDCIRFCECSGLEKAHKNLLGYFLYRHLPKSLRGYSIETCITFCLLSTAIVSLIAMNYPDNTFDRFADVARMYSSEIEYSPDNTEALMDEIEFITNSYDII